MFLSLVTRISRLAVIDNPFAWGEGPSDTHNELCGQLDYGQNASAAHSVDHMWTTRAEIAAHKFPFLVCSILLRYIESRNNYCSRGLKCTLNG